MVSKDCSVRQESQTKVILWPWCNVASGCRPQCLSRGQCTVKDTALSWVELQALFWCSGCVTFYLRNEGNACQHSRAVTRTQRGCIHACFQNSKAFYKQNGIVFTRIEPRRNTDQRGRLSSQCAVMSNGPFISWDQLENRSLCLTRRWTVGRKCLEAMGTICNSWKILRRAILRRACCETVTMRKSEKTVSLRAWGLSV